MRGAQETPPDDPWETPWEGADAAAGRAGAAFAPPSFLPNPSESKSPIPGPAPSNPGT